MNNLVMQINNQNIKYKLIIIIILSINILINIIVFIKVKNEPIQQNGLDSRISFDSYHYLDIAYSIRNFETNLKGYYTNKYFGINKPKNQDIGELIMPGYPLLISPFFENIDLIAIFQILLFSLSLLMLIKIIINKYLMIYLFLTIIWLSISSSWSYHNIPMIESSTISLLVFVIYYLDRYFKDYNTMDIVRFSIFFGILISVNNRFIFHFCGILPFFLFLKLFEKRIKFNHIIYSFLIVTAIMAPWHIRQYIHYGKLVLFSPIRTDTYKKQEELDEDRVNYTKFKIFSDYLQDSNNHPLKNNPKELEDYRITYYKKKSKDSIRYLALKEAGTLSEIKPLRVVYEPSKKSIEEAEKRDLALNKNKGGELVKKRKEMLGIKPVSIASNNTGDEVEDVRIVNYDEYGNIVKGDNNKSRGGIKIKGNKTESNQRELLIAQNKIQSGNNKKKNSKQEKSFALNIHQQKSKPVISNNNQVENRSVNNMKNEKQNIISQNNTLASNSKTEKYVKNTNVNNTKTEGKNNNSSNLYASATRTENKTINIPEGVAKLAENNIIRSVIRANPVSQKVLADFIIKNNLIVKSISVAGIMEELNKLKYTDSVKYNELMLQIVDLYKNKDSEYRKIIKEENLAKAKTISQSNQEITKKDEIIVNKSTKEVKKESVTKTKVIYIDSLSILVKQLEKELNKIEPVLIATNESTVALNDVNNSNKTVKTTTKESNQQIKTKSETKPIELTDAEIQKREEEKLSKFIVAKLNTKEQKIISPEITDKRSLTTANTDKTRNQKEISVVSDKTKLSTANTDKTGSQKEIREVIDNTNLITENIERQKSATTQTPNTKSQTPVIAMNVETSKPVGKSVAANIEQKQIAKSTENTDKSQKNSENQKQTTDNQQPSIAKNLEVPKQVGKSRSSKVETKPIDKSKNLITESTDKSQKNSENQKQTTDNQQPSIAKNVEVPKQVSKSVAAKIEQKQIAKPTERTENSQQSIVKSQNNTENQKQTTENQQPSIAKNVETPKQVGKSLSSKVETKPIDKSKNLITESSDKSQKNSENQRQITDNQQPAIAKNVEVPKQVSKSVLNKVESNHVEKSKTLITENTEKIQQSKVNSQKSVDKSPTTIKEQNHSTENNSLPTSNQTPIPLTKLDTQIVITKKVVKDPLKLADDTKSSKIVTDTIVVIKRSESFTGLVKVSNKYKEKISYDTVPKSIKSSIINSNQEKLNHPLVAYNDNSVNIIIQDMKVQRISVFGFDDELEFRKFENLRIRKMVPPYDQIIDALLKSHPKFGATPEKLQQFLSDFSYDKYRRLVYEKFEPSNKYELIWNRFKEQFVFYRTDFRLTPQWDARIYFPSHYNNWINWMLELIMVPLVLINIIPLIVAIYKKDWLIISLAVLVFLHILLHALVGYLPRYRITIYPAWITFAVYGYDQLTRYLIHIYKNRKDYSTRLLDIFTRKQTTVNQLNS